MIDSVVQTVEEREREMRQRGQDVLQVGVRGGEAVDELAVGVHVRAPDAARGATAVPALQRHQASDGQGTGRCGHERRTLCSL